MKKELLKLIHLLFIFLLISGFVQAEVTLPAVFGDNMVMQQKTEAAIWGKALPNKAIIVTTSWDEKIYTTQSDNEGKWKLKVETPSAGGPYNITISDGEILKLNNILIGEVWFCSGQSNMEMPVKGFPNQPVLGSNKTIAESTNESIRLFSVTRNFSLSPFDNFDGEWLECKPENVAEFSATAYYFGKMLQEVLGVPIGLINSSWGGTRIEPWISEEGIKQFDFISLENNLKNEKISQQTPSVLYNAMVHPMVGYAIKGVIWYQGESNRDEPENYLKLFPGLIENWREEWGIGKFPFYYAQIAPYDYDPRGLNSAYLREVQLKVSQIVPKTGMACLMDIGEKYGIHPANKLVTGERLAYIALANTYNKNGFEYSGPVLKDITVKGSLIELTFDHAKNGLTTYGKELENFKVAGENKRFYPAKAFITHTGLTLFCPPVANPVAVRYAFDNFVIGELYNTEGLPVSSFRTDNWEK